jgi:hypothetical protein
MATARDEALATEEPGAIGRFLGAQLALFQENRGVVDALGMPGLDPAVRRRLSALVADVVAPMVERGHKDGSLAPQFDVHDLLIAVRMIHGAIASASNIDRDPQPYVEIVAQGLHA